MKTFHYKAHTAEAQNFRDIAEKLLTHVFENKDMDFQLIVDDGDMDVWRYTFTVKAEYLKNIKQLKNN